MWRRAGFSGEALRRNKGEMQKKGALGSLSAHSFLPTTPIEVPFSLAIRMSPFAKQIDVLAKICDSTEICGTLFFLYEFPKTYNTVQFACRIIEMRTISTLRNFPALG